MADEFGEMDRLQLDAQASIDDTLGGRGVAPMEEMCDPDTYGCHPAKLGVESDDLGLNPPGVAEPEESDLSLLESAVGAAGGMERELGDTDRPTVVGEIDELVADAAGGVFR